MPTKLLIMIIGLLLTNLVNAASLTASVDRNKVTVNETLNFQLRYDQQANTDQLDLSTLKQDFDVLGIQPQNSSSMTIINGQSTRETLTIWNITLAPKREGTLVIPSFSIDGNVSNAIRVEVMKASAAIPQEQPMIVRLTPDTKKAYPGQQILIKVELLAQNSVSNLNGSSFVIDNTEVELLDQKSFRRIENGISWQVVEWVYALFPEQPGTLAIPAQFFTGTIQTANQRNRFDPFRQQRGQRISARSSATVITIEETPETNGVPWFPANNVSIRSQWSGDTSQMRVGEPLTRIIQIIANGQRASVIPPLAEISSVTYKTYKDQPQLDKQVTVSDLIGIRQESEAIVPSAAGVLELPEQRITWWNNKTKTWQEAVLPAESFEVLPALQNTGFAPPSGVPQFLPEKETGTSTVIEKTGIWWKIATGTLATLCLFQLWLLLARKPQRQVNDDENSATTVSKNKAWKDLQKALKSKDARIIRNALITWSQIAIPDQRIPSLQSLLSYLNDKNSEILRIQLSKLDESLYKGDSDLDIAALSASLDDLKNNLESKSKKQEGLAPLYPA